PPSYAWVRVGSDGHATVVTAMQDIGTGTRTVMAQIAAEELGIPLERVTVSLGDSARGPYAAISAGSSTTPSMGPAVRAAAADAKRQLLEIAAQRWDLEQRVLDIRDGQFVSQDGGAWPLTEITGLLEAGQILDAYKLPTSADVPEIVCELVDEPDAHLTNLGSKGLGEPPIIPVAAAIANAIRDATGAEIRELPITREEMLRALKEARRGAP